MTATQPTAPAKPVKNFTVRYVFRQAGRTYSGQSVYSGPTRKAALDNFTRENPHIISAHIAP